MCRARQALLRGMRPQATSQKSLCGVCPTHCIFCDIWKLATLIATRIPLYRKYSSPSSSGRASPTHIETYDWTTSSRIIEAQFQTQRARLASIMSICTVEGAEESDGLRIAHDRCRGSVEQLLYQERVLEETLLRASQSQSSSERRRPSMGGRRTSRECGAARSYYSDDRQLNASMVGIAI